MYQGGILTRLVREVCLVVVVVLVDDDDPTEVNFFFIYPADARNTTLGK